MEFKGTFSKNEVDTTKSIELLDCEHKILTGNYGFGNDILYKLCEEYNLGKLEENLNKNNIAPDWIPENNVSYKFKDVLAAQMWLIGRSYAASPERRSYRIKNENFNLSVKSDGLDTYFDILAEKLLGDKYITDEFKNIVNSFKTFKVINNQDSLIKSIIAVLKFNRMIKKVRYSIDESDIETYSKGKNEIKEEIKNNQTNVISFCSKFLHFHFPHQVFIIDSITKEHFKEKFKFGEEESYIKIVKARRDRDKEFIQEIENNKDFSEHKLSEPEIDYIKHCINNYCLVKVITTNTQFNGNKFEFADDIYIPRLIDTYVLMSNS